MTGVGRELASSSGALANSILGGGTAKIESGRKECRNKALIGIVASPQVRALIVSGSEAQLGADKIEPT